MTAIVRLEIGALTRRLAVSRMSVSRMVKDGRLPAPSYLEGRRVWRLDEIEAWEATHITSEPPTSVVERAARARAGKETPRAATRRASALSRAAPLTSSQEVRHGEV